MSRVLVIGGNGFIGRNIVNNLVQNGYQPVVYDIVPSDLDVEQHIGNIIDDSSFEEIVSSCEKIIYLISTVSPQKSMENNTSAYINDVPLLIRVLDTSNSVGIKRVIFASSGGTIYGEGHEKMSREDDETNPINHYAICKLCCEKILNLYNKLYKMENVSLRISNPYGFGQNPKSGVGAITTFANKIIENEPIVLFGDGRNYRDYIDVFAVSEAFRLACEWEFDTSITPVFNIGSGEALNLNEIIEIISNELEASPIIIRNNPREFDVKYIALDTSKAEQYLNFETPKNQKERIRNYVMSMKDVKRI